MVSINNNFNKNTLISISLVFFIIVVILFLVTYIGNNSNELQKNVSSEEEYLLYLYESKKLQAYSKCDNNIQCVVETAVENKDYVLCQLIDNSNVSNHCKDLIFYNDISTQVNLGCNNLTQRLDEVCTNYLFATEVTNITDFKKNTCVSEIYMTQEIQNECN